MESFVHLRKGTTPRRLHADLGGLKDDELRAVRNHDPIREPYHVLDLGAPEPAVDHLVSGEVPRQRLPEPRARGANEEDGSLGRRGAQVRGLEGLDVRLPLSGGRLLPRRARRGLAPYAGSLQGPYAY